MSKIMIVVGHPQRATFCEAIGHAYEKGALAAGHEAKLFMLSEMSFDPILRDGFRKEQTLEPALHAAYQSLAACDHLVLIFPLWCGDMPALLKGFIERILQPDLIARQNTETAMNWNIFAEQDRPHRHDDGHAGVDLSLVVPRARPQAADAQYPALHRHQARAPYALRHDWDVKAGPARALAARDRGAWKNGRLRQHAREPQTEPFGKYAV